MSSSTMNETTRMKRICYNVVHQFNDYLKNVGELKAQEHGISVILNFMQPLRVIVPLSVHKHFKPKWVKCIHDDGKLLALSVYNPFLSENIRLINLFFKEAIEEKEIELIPIMYRECRGIEGLQQHIQNLSNFKFS